MMRRIIVFIFCISIFSVNNSSAQNENTLADKLIIKKDFLNGPMYSLDGKYFVNASMPFRGTYKMRFRSLFDHNQKEFEYIKKSENKRRINNLFGAICGGALGLALANTLSKDPLWDKSVDKYFYLSSAILIPICITIDSSGYKDLKKAVSLRNERF